jgi:ketosteroid isomerase-like protein
MIHPQTFIVSLGFLALSLLACDRSRETHDDAASTSGIDEVTESALRSLRDADEAWDRSTISADSFVSFFTDDALWLWAGGPRVIGKEEIRATAERYWSRPGWVLDWEPTSIGVNNTHDVGYTAGDWQTNHDGADGQLIESSGSYMAIWKKDESGMWKVEMEIEFAGDKGMFQRQVAATR